ncbi:MAG: DUF1109 domain-containing protein [Novosphingobium sp.]|nr:MAG: DUF1109 domain-containing protein [Novosphingobium sp.]
MTSNDTLILSLSADLVPVRRRSLLREAALLVSLVLAEFGVLLALGLIRPDMPQVIGSGFMVWKLGSLVVLAAACGAIALRSFAPMGWPRRGLTGAFALVAAALIAGLYLVRMPEDAGALFDRLMPEHGLICATAIVVLSLPLMALLGAMMRRAAPIHPKRSALASGLAAASCGALIFASCCPMNDPLYIAVWYLVGCGAVTAAARWLLPRRFRL